MESNSPLSNLLTGRRKQGGGGAAPQLGAANFKGLLESGFAFATTLVSRVSQAAGFAAEQFLKLTTNQVSGFNISTFSSGSVNYPQAAGFASNNVIIMNGLPEDIPGVKQQYFINYTGQKYVATATNIGPDNYSNPSNAQGAQDGFSAAITGNALGARDGQLRCQFETVGSKDALTILTVRVRYYFQVSGTLLGNGNTKLHYRIGNSGPWTQIGTTYTNDTNNLTAPVTFTMTSTLDTWQKIRDFEALVTHNSAALNTYTTRVDAVMLEITAETGVI